MSLSSYTLTQPADLDWGTIVDGKYTGLVGQLDRKVGVDGAGWDHLCLLTFLLKAFHNRSYNIIILIFVWLSHAKR